MLQSIVVPIVWLGGLGLLFGVVLGLAAKKFAVEESENVLKIKEVLPGANCGGCGFPGCGNFAEALSNGEALPGSCTAISPMQLAQINDILGADFLMDEKLRAVVLCGGCGEKSLQKFNPYGIFDCREAMLIMGGNKVCEYGCLGFGTCEKVCPNDAIHVDASTSRVVVDEEKCNGCGACERACPKRIIVRIPVTSRVVVSCKSNRKGAQAKKICSVACIGCGLCKKACEYGAIEVENNLASIDYEKCVNCGKCVEKCPTKAIQQHEVKSR